jgi:hypothetical protein
MFFKIRMLFPSLHTYVKMETRFRKNYLLGGFEPAGVLLGFPLLGLEELFFGCSILGASF